MSISVNPDKPLDPGVPQLTAVSPVKTTGPEKSPPPLENVMNSDPPSLEKQEAKEDDSDGKKTMLMTVELESPNFLTVSCQDPTSGITFAGCLFAMPETQGTNCGPLVEGGQFEQWKSMLNREHKIKQAIQEGRDPLQALTDDDKKGAVVDTSKITAAASRQTTIIGQGSSRFPADQTTRRLRPIYGNVLCAKCKVPVNNKHDKFARQQDRAVHNGGVSPCSSSNTHSNTSANKLHLQQTQTARRPLSAQTNARDKGQRSSQSSARRTILNTTSAQHTNRHPNSNNNSGGRRSHHGPVQSLVNIAPRPAGPAAAQKRKSISPPPVVKDAIKGLFSQPPPLKKMRSPADECSTSNKANTKTNKTEGLSSVTPIPTLIAQRSTSTTTTVLPEKVAATGTAMISETQPLNLQSIKMEPDDTNRETVPNGGGQFVLKNLSKNNAHIRLPVVNDQMTDFHQLLEQNRASAGAHSLTNQQSASSTMTNQRQHRQVYLKRTSPGGTTKLVSIMNNGTMGKSPFSVRTPNTGEQSSSTSTVTASDNGSSRPSQVPRTSASELLAKALGGGEPSPAGSIPRVVIKKITPGRSMVVPAVDVGKNSLEHDTTAGSSSPVRATVGHTTIVNRSASTPQRIAPRPPGYSKPASTFVQIPRLQQNTPKSGVQYVRYMQQSAATAAASVSANSNPHKQTPTTSSGHKLKFLSGPLPMTKADQAQTASTAVLKKVDIKLTKSPSRTTSVKHKTRRESKDGGSKEKEKAVIKEEPKESDDSSDEVDSNTTYTDNPRSVRYWVTPTPEENPLKLRPKDIIWAKMKSEPYWPAEIFSFNTNGEATVLWFGGSQHGFVKINTLERFSELFERRYNPKRADKHGYHSAVLDAIRKNKTRTGCDNYDYCLEHLAKNSKYYKQLTGKLPPKELMSARKSRGKRRAAPPSRPGPLKKPEGALAQKEQIKEEADVNAQSLPAASASTSSTSASAAVTPSTGNDQSAASSLLLTSPECSSSALLMDLDSSTECAQHEKEEDMGSDQDEPLTIDEGTVDESGTVADESELSTSGHEQGTDAFSMLLLATQQQTGAAGVD